LAAAQGRIDLGRVRPIADVDAVDHQHVAEAAVIFLHLLRDELRERRHRVGGVREIGLDQGHAAVDGMRMRIDHARHQELALEIDPARRGAGGLFDRL
jgi:hypothetical protein